MSGIICKPVRSADTEHLLLFWETQWGEEDGRFRRYFDADPWYREGDAFAAWVGERIVSAVHLARRPLHWEGGTLWCGAIARTSTTSEFTRRGIASDLLRLAIERMEQEGFAFSYLVSWPRPLYTRLGWRTVSRPRPTVEFRRDSRPLEVALEPVVPSAALLEIYDHTPRPLQLQRSLSYFRDWIGWHWTEWPVEVLRLGDRGYACLRPPDGLGGVATLQEWRALDAEAERETLEAVAVWAASRGVGGTIFEAVPQFGELEALEDLCAMTFGTDYMDNKLMLRNVSLAEDEYQRIVGLYSRSSAVWWPSDDF